MRYRSAICLIACGAVILAGCAGEVKDSDKGDASWCEESIKKYNAVERKQTETYDITDDRTDQDTHFNNSVDKERKCFQMTLYSGGMETIFTIEDGGAYSYGHGKDEDEPWYRQSIQEDYAESLLESCDIDIKYVTDYEIVGKEELDGKDAVKVKLHEDGRKTLAETIEEQDKELFKGKIESSENLEKAYKDAVKVKQRDYYVWFDGDSHEPLKTEQDNTKDKIFMYYYMKGESDTAGKEIPEKVISVTVFKDRETQKITVPEEFEDITGTEAE